MENVGDSGISGQVSWSGHIPGRRCENEIFASLATISTHLSRFYDKRKVRAVLLAKDRRSQSPPTPLPLPLPLISPIKLREQPNDSIERTAYASRSRNNWELPVIPRTDPIGIERGKGKKERSWLNRD